MTSVDQHIPSSIGDKAVAGDTYELNVTVEEDDGTPKNLTSASISFALSRYRGDETVVEKTDSDPGTEITDAQNGKLTVRLEPSDTEGLGRDEGEEYDYEIEVTDSVGDVATVTVGTFTLYTDMA
jgi:uncharacterized protein YjdB